MSRRKVTEAEPRKGDVTDGQPGGPGRESPIKVLRRHPYACAVVFLPVVASIIAGSVIHEF